ERRRIVDGEEDREQVAVVELVRVEGHAHHLGMAAAPRAHLVVVGIRGLAPHVTGLDRLHALELVEDRLEAPEAAAGERRNLIHFNDSVGRWEDNMGLVPGDFLMAQTTRPPRRPAAREALPEQAISREVL